MDREQDTKIKGQGKRNGRQERAKTKKQGRETRQGRARGKKHDPINENKRERTREKKQRQKRG